MRETTSTLTAPVATPADLTDEDMQILGVRHAPIDLSLEQGSLEWSLARSKAITASEVAGIAGESKWAPKTMQAVLLRKMGRTPNVDSVAMSHGRAMEPIARAMIEHEFQRPFPAVVMQRGSVLASLDGYDPETQTLIEIKCPYSVSQIAEDVPKHYVAQLATQAWVSMARRVLFCQYYGGTMLVVNVDADELRKFFMLEYAGPVCEAYRHLSAGTLPYKPREDEEWTDAAQQFIEIQKISEKIEEALDAARKHLIDLSENEMTSGGGVTVNWIVREGNVNWKAKEIVGALKSAGIDPNEFRAKPTRYAKISVEKPQ